MSTGETQDNLFVAWPPDPEALEAAIASLEPAYGATPSLIIAAILQRSPELGAYSDAANILEDRKTAQLGSRERDSMALGFLRTIEALGKLARGEAE